MTNPTSIQGYSEPQLPSFYPTDSFYRESGSSNIFIENVISKGFGVGFMIQPGNLSYQGEYIKMLNCISQGNIHAISFGNTQLRQNYFGSCRFEDCYIGISNKYFGRQTGKTQGLFENCGFDRTYQIANIRGQYSYITVLNHCYGELIGWVGSSSLFLDKAMLHIIDSEFSFSETTKYGVSAEVVGIGINIENSILRGRRVFGIRTGSGTFMPSDIICNYTTCSFMNINNTQGQLYSIPIYESVVGRRVPTIRQSQCTININNQNKRDINTTWYYSIINSNYKYSGRYTACSQINVTPNFDEKTGLIEIRTAINEETFIKAAGYVGDIIINNQMIFIIESISADNGYIKAKVVSGYYKDGNSYKLMNNLVNVNYTYNTRHRSYKYTYTITEINGTIITLDITPSDISIGDIFDTFGTYLYDDALYNTTVRKVVSIQGNQITLNKTISNSFVGKKIYGKISTAEIVDTNDNYYGIVFK